MQKKKWILKRTKQWQNSQFDKPMPHNCHDCQRWSHGVSDKNPSESKCSNMDSINVKKVTFAAPREDVTEKSFPPSTLTKIPCMPLWWLCYWRSGLVTGLTGKIIVDAQDYTVPLFMDLKHMLIFTKSCDFHPWKSLWNLKSFIEARNLELLIPKLKCWLQCCDWLVLLDRLDRLTFSTWNVWNVMNL